MKFYFYILTLLTGLFLFGCSNCDASKLENNLEKHGQSINSVAKEKFNGKFKIINNQSSNYALVVDGLVDAKSPVINKMSFFIYDLITNKVLLEDEVVNCNVFWETDNLVTISRIKGMIKKDSETNSGNKVYSYDVIKRKKYFH